MNPYMIVAYVVVVVAATVSGFKLGMDHEKANQIDKQQLLAEAVDAANQASATAIANLRPKYTTIQNEVQREVTTNTVYLDCKHSPDGLRLLNQALNGGVSSGDSKLPKADTAK